MARTTRPKVRVGEWIECWVHKDRPEYGRIRGMVKDYTGEYKRYFGHEFKINLGGEGEEPRILTRPDAWPIEFINRLYTGEIIRRLTPVEIVTLKLGNGYWLSRDAGRR